MKRKICFPITSRAYYGRQRLLIEKLHAHPGIELHLVLGGSILLDKYGKDLPAEISASGFNIAASLFNVIDGGNHVAMAKTSCLTALEFVNQFHSLDPDIVLISGDRFEQLPIAMAAAYLNKPVAHLEGGDVTGNIDESVRHAITKLAHIHFVTNDDAYRRVITMGEDPAYVFNTGSLDVEYAASIKTTIDNDLINSYGVGSPIDIAQPFLVVLQHPVTSDLRNREHINVIVKAITGVGLPTVWFWPNSDAGTNEIAEALRHFREYDGAAAQFRFVTNLPADEFVALMRLTACLVGNSSAGMKESSYLGTPVVNIGARQHGRLRGPNVIDVDYDIDEIRAAVEMQIEHGRYPSSSAYYRSGTSDRIVALLSSLPLYTQKFFHERSDFTARRSVGKSVEHGVPVPR